MDADTGETVAGPDLATWIAGHARPPAQREIDALLPPLLDALAALHAANVLHLAISPRTVIMRDGRDPVLTRPSGHPGKAGAPPSPYEAPELAPGRLADVGPRTDLYGLGATIYTLLTGHAPAPAATGEHWLPPVIPDPERQYRPEFLQTVAMCLAPQISQRPPSVAALRLLLLEGADEAPAMEPPANEPPLQEKAAQPRGAERDIGQRSPLRRVPWLAIAGLALVILAGIGYLGLRPALPPLQRVAVDQPPAVDNTPATPAPLPAPKTADNPVPPAEPAPLTEAATPPAPAPDPIETRIAAMTDRDELLRLAQEAPQARSQVEARLSALGFLRVASFDTVSWIRPGEGEAFRECADCPDMIALPAGRFVMGSPASEAGRQEDEDDTPGPGGNPVPVTIARPFAVSRTAVTRGQFAAFMRETGYKIADGCYAREGGRQLRTDLSWQSPGFSQDDRHPVVCVSWEDAHSYGAWLSAKTGNTYRLLSEAEWEYAARAGSAGRFTFGDDDGGICQYGNGADQTASETFPAWSVAPCRDGYVFTAPVASFKPNKFGLHDMHGNVWQWIGDCQSGSLAHLAQGGPAASPCQADAAHILRGGSFSDPPDRLRSAARIAGPPRDRDQIVGFRLARELQPAR